jgi:hypothetical protein
MSSGQAESPASSANAAAADADASFAARLHGAWSLVSFRATLPDGSSRAPYGESAHGQLLYLCAGGPHGRVSVHIARAPAERPAWATADPAAGAAEERAAAAGSYRAYCGTFTVRRSGEAVIIAHGVEMSLMPNRVGTTLERRATFSRGAGGEELLLLEPLVPTPGAASEALLWRRSA